MLIGVSTCGLQLWIFITGIRHSFLNLSKILNNAWLISWRNCLWYLRFQAILPSVLVASIMYLNTVQSKRKFTLTFESFEKYSHLTCDLMMSTNELFSWWVIFWVLFKCSQYLICEKIIYKFCSCNSKIWCEFIPNWVSLATVLSLTPANFFSPVVTALTLATKTIPSSSTNLTSVRVSTRENLLLEIYCN